MAAITPRSRAGSRRSYAEHLVVRIAGSVALVTGASSGIGEAVAIDLARRGATVAVVARRADALEETAAACRQHSARSCAVVADLAEPDAADRVVDEVRDRVGPIGILVNNAGISLHRHALLTKPADVERVMQVNFMAAVRTTMAVLPDMAREGRGSVVNVTSVAGYIPNPKESAYGASKAALHLWSHGVAIDLHGTGVHVGVLSPGPIDTEIWGKDENPSSYRGRKYPPQVVADAVARMVQKELAFVTVPRRFGAMGPLYALPLVSRAVRRGLVAFEAGGEGRRRRG